MAWDAADPSNDCANLSDPAAPTAVLRAARQAEPPPAGSIMAVITLGYDAVALYPGVPVPAAFPVAPGRDGLDGLMDEVATGIEQRGYCLALYPSWASEPARQRLETVRRILGTTRLVHRPVNLPPLAGAALASLVAALAGSVERPGEILAGLAALERWFVTIAWLRSVARLTTPAPSLGQHAASWLPWTQFAVTTEPTPAVRRLTTNAQPDLPRMAGNQVQVAVAGSDPTGLARIGGLLEATFDAPRTMPVAPSSTARQWWGTTRVVEAVPFPTGETDARTIIASGPSLTACRWCAEPIPSEPCPFCHMNAGAISTPNPTI